MRLNGGMGSAEDDYAKRLQSDRENYHGQQLRADESPADPIELFNDWMTGAMRAYEAGDIAEPVAMQLATVSDQGEPSVRTVLLRGVIDDGFVFYTSYESDKGNHLAAHARAALHFYWPKPLYRQVRIQGQVSRVARKVSEKYFKSRPRDSQLAAWAAQQSRPLRGDDQLAELAQESEAKFDGQDVPCPPHWGGYQLLPKKIEFWQGQPNRLHNRVVYRKVGAAWEKTLLAP